jgi:hypothetical protein
MRAEYKGGMQPPRPFPSHFNLLGSHSQRFGTSSSTCTALFVSSSRCPTAQLFARLPVTSQTLVRLPLALLVVLGLTASQASSSWSVTHSLPLPVPPPPHTSSRLSSHQASSLSHSCNPPKHAYDTCFNTWFKSYLILVSPPLAHPLDSPDGKKEREKRAKEIDAMKHKLEKECGERYRSYQECLKVCPVPLSRSQIPSWPIFLRRRAER